MKKVNNNIYIDVVKNVSNIKKSSFYCVYNFSEGNRISLSTKIDLYLKGVKKIYEFWECDEIAKIKSIPRRNRTKEDKLLRNQLKEKYIKENTNKIYHLAKMSKENKCLFVCNENKINAPLFCLLALKINNEAYNKKDIFLSKDFEKKVNILFENYSKYL